MGIDEEILEDIEVDEEFEKQEPVSAEEIQKLRQQREERAVREKNKGNQPQDKLKRHAVIKALIDSNQAGEETPTEVQKALKDKGINVSLPTICKDLREMTNITPGTMKKIDNMLVGTLKGYLNQLDAIASGSDNDETRIRAINAAFDDTRKLYDILDTIATRTVLEETERTKLGKLGQPINEIIQFIDSPERVDKDKYYVEERNKIIVWLIDAINNMAFEKADIYQDFSNPTAYNTFRKTIDDILEIVKSLQNVPHLKKTIQQEKGDKDISIKMSE